MHDAPSDGPGQGVRAVISGGTRGGAALRQPVVAFLSWGDRFEDFHDKIGISIDVFREQLTGTWLFNYVEALQTAGLRPVLYFVSAHVREPVRFTHRPTGASLCFLPAPWSHRKLQGARDRLGVSSPLAKSFLSYFATPWPALARELRRDRCEAVLCQEYEYPRFDEAVVLGRVLGIPVFATYQGGNTPRTVLERPLRGIAVRRAAGLVVGARREAERLLSEYNVPPERVALVPNATDMPRAQRDQRQAARHALGLPLDAQVVVWHGRVVLEYKGLDVLVEAWKQVCARRDGASILLLLVGSGQDDEILRQHLTCLPSNAVRWERRYVLDRDTLWQYLFAADVAALSSRHEGFPVAVIEAMAAGLPVVATDVSGVAEALGEEPTGLIVPPEDPAALAEALERLLDDEEARHRLGDRARQRAASEFTFEAVGTRLRAFMEERGAFRPRHA